jgi:hypothetical protein
MTTTDTHTTASLLPAPFADLEPYSPWIVETEPERYDRRLASTMEEMQAFYDAAFPRLPEAMAYCDQYPLDDLPDDAKHLLFMMLSLVEISFPIERWHQARVPDSGANAVYCIHEPTL